MSGDVPAIESYRCAAVLSDGSRCPHARSERGDLCLWHWLREEYDGLRLERVSGGLELVSSARRA